MKKIYLLLFTAISVSLSAQVEGTWKLAPMEGALAVGPSQGDGSWWSISASDVTTRACLFDDSIKFELGVIAGGGVGGPMQHYLDGSTWIENWQDAGGDRCDVPVAPHNGSTSYGWAYANNQLTVSGVGAHIGLPKVFDTGELSDPANAPSSITYDLTFSANGDTMTSDINYGGPTGGWWRFVYVKASLVAPPPPQTYDVTLKLDANNITVGANGIYAGGGVLGDAQAYPMTDNNGDGIWECVATFPEAGGNYIFLNNPANGGDWGTKEDLTGLSCADGQYNDRLMPALTANSTLCAIFASCDPCQNPTGIENNNNVSTNLYPNPTNGLLNINSVFDISLITIYDVLGKEILTKNINNKIDILNVESLINGVYFIKIDLNNNTTSTLRFVKK